MPYQWRRLRDNEVTANHNAWVPVQPSTASRSVPIRTKGSFRVDRVLLRENRVLSSESMVEANVAAVVETLPNVASLRDQWPCVSYVDEHGIEREHTFDFHVTLVTGRRIAICVKPFDKVQESGLLNVLRLIKQQSALGRFADEVVILTERDVENGRARNAREILRARRMRNEREVEAARAAVASVWGSVRFHDLLVGLESPAHRRNAIWCLIDEGFLVPETDGRIDDRTYLRVAERWRAAA